jgi:hypothetical protein
MTQARIEIRLDLETSGSQPFRRKPSLLCWNDGIILTVHQQYLGEVWIDRYHPHSVGQHTAFVAKTKAEVDAFHAAAQKAGGTDNGTPGPREGQSTPVYYAAFVIDPDGNNMEAVFRGD